MMLNGYVHFNTLCTSLYVLNTNSILITAIMAVKEAREPSKCCQSSVCYAKNRESITKQPTFNWKAEDKYQELQNFEIEIVNIFMTIAITYKKTERSQSYSVSLVERTRACFFAHS